MVLMIQKLYFFISECMMKNGGYPESIGDISMHFTEKNSQGKMISSKKLKK